MKPTLDLARAPLIVATFFESITAGEVTAHFLEIAEAAEQFRRVGVVIDLTRGSLFEPTLRKHASEQQTLLFQRVGKKVVGVAFVVPSATTRGLVTALQWLAPPPFPTHFAATRADASRWAQEKLDVPAT